MKTEQRALESKASCGFGATQVFSMHITGLYFLLVMQGCRCVCVCRLVGEKTTKEKPMQKTNKRTSSPATTTSTNVFPSHHYIKFESILPVMVL